MGMYTEIYVNVDLKIDTPEDIIITLKTMCHMTDDDLILKDKPRRWKYLFNDGSFYTPSTSCANLTFNNISHRWSLLGKGDIKNYDSEIEQFFKWLIPYIDGEAGDFIGYTRYEEEPLPTLVLLEK